MANKHRKVWKVVSRKPLSGKQTQPKGKTFSWKPNQIFFLTGKCFPLTNFPNGKQTQESLESGFPESEFRETNMAYFSVSFLFIIDDLFFHFFTQWLLICLVRCMHKFFDLHLRFFYVKKHVEKFCMFNFFFIMF